MLCVTFVFVYEGSLGGGGYLIEKDVLLTNETSFRISKRFLVCKVKKVRHAFEIELYLLRANNAILQKQAGLDDFYRADICRK